MFVSCPRPMSGKRKKVMVLYEKIQNDPLEFPPEVNMSAGLKRLLRAMMEKGAAQRITLDQVCGMMKSRLQRCFEQFFLNCEVFVALLAVSCRVGSTVYWFAGPVFFSRLFLRLASDLYVATG